MAKILDDNQIVSGQIQDFLKDSLGTYSERLSSAPIFVTFYSKDHLNSTHGVGLDAVAQVVGPDSPVKYNQIENFPLYQVSGVTLSTDNTGFGLEADVQADALVIPDTIVPRVDDHFVSSYEGNEITYRISNVESSIVHGKRYYKIDFFLANALPSELDEQVSEFYSVIPDDSSPEKTHIVLKTNAELIIDLDKLRSKFTDLFAKFFFNRDFSMIGYRNQSGEFVYDHSVSDFLVNHGLLQRERAYRDEIYPDIIEADFARLNTQYPRTIYNSLEVKDRDSCTAQTVVLSVVSKPATSNIAMYPDTLMFTTYDDSVIPVDATNIPVWQGLPEYIADDSDTFISPNAMSTVLKNYLTEADANTIFDSANSVELQMFPSSDNFFLIPCVLFVLKKVSQGLRT